MDYRDWNMKKSHGKFKKVLAITLGILASLVVLIFLLLSPITKYLIEKYDVKYTGREITLSYAYVNPFTGYIYLHNLRIQEAGSDSTFIAAEGLGAHINLRKAFSGVYEISDIELTKPHSAIIQTGKALNLDDLITRFTAKTPGKKGPPLQLSLLKIHINDGILYYRDNLIPINYSVIHLNIESPGYKWNSDTIAAVVSLASGNGKGTIKGNIAINVSTLDYKLDAVIDKLELKFLEQYFKVMSNYGSFRASLDATLNTTGNFTDAEAIMAKGLVSINDFHFGETPYKDFASFENFTLSVLALNPGKKIYNLDSVSLSHPYFKYEEYDYKDNVERMFDKKNGTAVIAGKSAQFNLLVEIGDYIAALAKNFFHSNYKVNSLAIRNGNLIFNDYAHSEKFSIAANPIFITADSISKNKNRVKVYCHTGFKPYGGGVVNLSINPKDSSDFDLFYSFDKVPITLFNPYLISYTSFPLDRGTLEFSGTWNVRSGMIQSNNHILVIDPRISRRIRNKDSKWLPLRFAMFFVRETGNVTDYQIPISGNLNKPNVHWRDVILDALRNAVVKPIMTVYRTKVKETEGEIEEHETLKWEGRQRFLYRRQEKFLNAVADLMVNNPTISISVYPRIYTDKEREYILLFEAKKRYYMAAVLNNNKELSERDSMEVERMSIKDTLFLKFLNKKTGAGLLYTVQDKCLAMLGTGFVNAKCHQLDKERRDAFLSCFKEKAVSNRVKIFNSEDRIPYNGFSFYNIQYHGEVPPSLQEAYERMKEFDDESPREKYKKERLRDRIKLN
jgi:hypothetical protein